MRSQPSILSGTCPTVVDHKLRINTDWKKSMELFVVNSDLETSVCASSRRGGASRAAKSSVVCRTAIRQALHNSNGDLAVRVRRSWVDKDSSSLTQRP